MTGGAGFIGSHLCDRIIQEKPSRLIVVDDFSLGKQRNVRLFAGNRNVRIYRTDAADYPTMDRILEKERIDVAFDLAVIPLPKSLELPMETVETNVKLTTTLCELLRKKRFKTLVHCSSSEAYGNALHVPMDESHPQLPLTPYAASKIEGPHRNLIQQGLRPRHRHRQTLQHLRPSAERVLVCGGHPPEP